MDFFFFFKQEPSKAQPPRAIPSGDASPPHTPPVPRAERSCRGRRAALTALPAKRPQASAARAAPSRARGAARLAARPGRSSRPARTCCCCRRRCAGAGPGRAPARPPLKRQRRSTRPRRPRGLRCSSGRCSLPSCPAPSAQPCSVPGLAPLPWRSKGFSERRASVRASPAFKNTDKNPRGKRSDNTRPS